MSQTVVEKAVCDNCGVDIRENTLFCYNCGSRVAEPEPAAKAESGLVTKADTGTKVADLGEQIRIEPPTEEEKKRAKAAAERKKARINSRKRPEVVWEPADDEPDRLLLLIAVLIAITAGVVVMITILWR
jgi:hypothetical protein